MKILVTGKNGQLGKSFQKLVNDRKNYDLAHFDYFFVGRN